MGIWRWGGYRGGRPASEMGPPKATPRDVERLVGNPLRDSPDYRQMWADAEVDREYSVADTRHWREAWESANEQLTLALRREAHLKGVAEDGLRLAALARYHAQGAEISQSDREQIRELCDRLQGKPAADLCTCAGPFSAHPTHPHGLRCLCEPCESCRREPEGDPWPAPEGWCSRCGESHADESEHSICFCGTSVDEHPPGPPCPPPPPPGVPHG